MFKYNPSDILGVFTVISVIGTFLVILTGAFGLVKEPGLQKYWMGLILYSLPITLICWIVIAVASKYNLSLNWIVIFPLPSVISIITFSGYMFVYSPIIDPLIDRGINYGEKDYFSNELEKKLMLAIYDGKINEVKSLIDQGVNLNCTGKYASNAIKASVESRRPEILSLMLEKDLNPNLKIKIDNEEYDTVKDAIQSKDPQYLNLLIEKGLDVSIERKYPLLFMLKDEEPSSVEMLKVLIRAGVKVDTPYLGRTYMGRLLLGLNLSVYRVEMILMLLKAGADPYLEQRGGKFKTPIEELIVGFQRYKPPFESEKQSVLHKHLLNILKSIEANNHKIPEELKEYL